MKSTGDVEALRMAADTAEAEETIVGSGCWDSLSSGRVWVETWRREVEVLGELELRDLREGRALGGLGEGLAERRTARGWVWLVEEFGGESGCWGAIAERNIVSNLVEPLSQSVDGNEW